jgi:hypothetical protein
LFSTVSGAPAHFVFHKDEIGHQGLADAQEMVCFVPGDFEEPFVYYLIPRTGKWITQVSHGLAQNDHKQSTVNGRRPRKINSGHFRMDHPVPLTTVLNAFTLPTYVDGYLSPIQ